MFPSLLVSLKNLTELKAGDSFAPRFTASNAILVTAIGAENPVIFTPVAVTPGIFCAPFTAFEKIPVPLPSKPAPGIIPTNPAKCPTLLAILSTSFLGVSPILRVVSPETNPEPT